VRERLRERGATELGGPARAFVAPQQGVAYALDLPAAGCVTFVALGVAAVRDLSLVLYDGDGAEVAADRVPGEGGLVHVCPGGAREGDATRPEPGRPRRGAAGEPGGAARRVPYHLVVRATRGRGAALVSAFALAKPGDARFDGLFDGILAPAVADGEVERRLAIAAGKLTARGFVSSEPPLVEQLAEGEATRRVLPMAEAHCYAVAVAASDGIADVDLFVFDPHGAEIARHLGDERDPSLEVCPAEGGPHTVEARAFSGSGAVGLLVLAGPDLGARRNAPPPGAPTAGEEPTAPAASITRAADALVARGFGAARLLVTDGEIGTLETGALSYRAGAGCTVFFGAATAGTDLDLHLLDAAGRVIEEDTGVHTTARVAACLPAPATLRLVARAYGRDGRYAIAAVPAPPTLVDTRALRIEEASAPLVARGYAVRSQRTVALDEGGRLEVPLSVPAGRCAALAAAGAAGVADVDVFVRAASGRLLASETGAAPLARVSRCAAADEALVAEVVAYRGRGDVEVWLLEGPP
jgi:hypothetical protein